MSMVMRGAHEGYEPIIDSYQTLLRFTAARGTARQPLLRVEEIDPLSRLLLDRGFERASVPRVVLCGEVKAGKSTLLNAICGATIAATDHFEMTGWIARYWPSDEAFARIHRYDGTEDVTSPEAFVAKCNARGWSAAELAQIEAVDVGLTSSRVPVAFVDAPGMGSIRRENEVRLMRAIDQADLVAWILDVDALGPERVAALAKTLDAHGTPQIAILTKCDLVDEPRELEEIRCYASKTIRVPEEHVFCTSALRAMESAPCGLAPDGSGVEPLLAFLSRDVAVRHSALRAQAERAYTVRLAELAAGLLQRVDAQLATVRDGIRDFERIVGKWRDAVQSRAETELERMVQEELFRGHRDALQGRIAEALSQGGEGALSNEAVQRIFRDVLGSDYYNRFWQSVLGDAAGRVATIWSQELAEFAPEIERAVSNVSVTALDSSAGAWSPQLLEAEANSAAASTLTEGLKTSLGIAGVASAWAWLGSTAAHLTLGAALGAVGFPILLMGAGVSAGLAWWRHKKEGRNPEAVAESVVDEMSRHFRERVLRDALFPKLESMNAAIADRIRGAFAESLLAHLPAGDLSALEEEVRQRLRSLSYATGSTVA